MLIMPPTGTEQPGQACARCVGNLREAPSQKEWENGFTFQETVYPMDNQKLTDNSEVAKKCEQSVGNYFRTEKQQITDPEEIASAAKVLARIVDEDWPESQMNRLSPLLLKALCQLCISDSRGALEGWDPAEIAAVMVSLGAPWGRLSQEDARQRVNDHWKGLLTLWEERKASVLDKPDKYVDFIEVKLEKPSSSGGRGVKARYRLLFFVQSSMCQTKLLKDLLNHYQRGECTPQIIKHVSRTRPATLVALLVVFND
jgi:hypothetical protein